MRVTKIDRDALHRYLFRRADRFGRLKLVLKDLSEELELGYCNLSVVISGMENEGRLVKIGGARQQTKTFRVVDPAEWQPDPKQP